MMVYHLAGHKSDRVAAALCGAKVHPRPWYELFRVRPRAQSLRV